MRKKRNEVQIIYEFLCAINNGNTQTSFILRKVNIPYNKYDELMKQLQDNEMIKVSSDENKTSIEILEKGREFIHQYRNFSTVLEKSYGLKL